MMNLIWFIGFGGGETVVITSRIAALVFLAVTYFALTTMPDLHERITRCLPWLVLLAVVFNAYNLAHPFAFVPQESDFAFMFRAAGIYVNPNTAGAAIVLGMLLSMPAVKERWRAWFVCISAVGVAMTLSRGAILMFLCVCIGLTFLGALSRRVVWTVIAIVAGVLAILLLLVGPALLDLFGGVEQLERLMILLNPGDAADFSQDERVYLAEHGWAQFIGSPLAGNGVGSTETWVLRASTHNQYLQFMSDFGVLGALIMPVLALVLVWGRTFRDVIPLAVAGCVILWSFLSHNVLTEYFWLMAIAMAAAAPSVRRPQQLPGAGVAFAAN
jgi:O-antigen ligase